MTHVIIELEMSHAKRCGFKQDEDSRSCIALTIFQHMCTIFIFVQIGTKVQDMIDVDMINAK